MINLPLPGILLKLVITAAALAVAAWLLPGITVESWQSLGVAALIFGLLNALAKPLLVALTCPLIFLTLGLFLFVLNAVMLGLTSWVAGEAGVGFRVDSFGTAFMGAIIISVVGWVLDRVVD